MWETVPRLLLLIRELWLPFCYTAKEAAALNSPSWSIHLKTAREEFFLSIEGNCGRNVTPNGLWKCFCVGQLNGNYIQFAQ